MQQPKVSVIVPVYNVEKYLKQCLNSIVNQTYKNLEIIIVNDGTKDNSMKIVEEYLQDKRIKVINKENGGLGSARNRGIEEATGDYISFVDSDDYISLNIYEELLKKIEENDIIIFNYSKFDDKSGEILYEKYINDKELETIIPNEYNYLYSKISTSCWNKLYKTSYIRENSFKFLEILYEDVLWNIEVIFKTSKINLVNKSYYYYRINRNDSIMGKSSKGRSKNDKKFQEFQKYSYEQIYNGIEKFKEKNLKELSVGQRLYLLLERERWQAKIDNNIFLEKINMIFQCEYFKLEKKEKEILVKKFQELLGSRDVEKINGISILDKFYWKNKVITLSLIRKIIKKYLFKKK